MEVRYLRTSIICMVWVSSILLHTAEKDLFTTYSVELTFLNMHFFKQNKAHNMMDIRHFFCCGFGFFILASHFTAGKATLTICRAKGLPFF